MLLRPYILIRPTHFDHANTTCRSLQATALELEKKLTADHLKHDLEKRHTREELVDRHVLRDTHTAPSLQATAFDLERQLAADNLKHDLEKRHTREELVERTSHLATLTLILPLARVGHSLDTVRPSFDLY